MDANANRQCRGLAAINSKNSFSMKHTYTLVKLWLMGTALLAASGLAAQVQVTGHVTDQADKSALIGASVVEKGVSNGVITDIDGNFTLTVASDQATLVVSYTGYETQEIPLAGRTNVEIAIGNSPLVINEVVVVGYGTQRKSDLTGAVGSVKGKDITRVPTASLEQALQGKVAGVYVSPASGEPGAGATIRIRGTGTLNNANPLYVVDGMLLDDISFLNPQDVESVEVLKDASATSIYGNRGANGVIIITTKRGTSGRRAIVTFSSYYGTQQLIRKLPLLNAAEFAQYYNEYKGDTLRFPDPAAEGVGTDWQDRIFEDAPIGMVQLGVNGIWNKFQYNVSGNYFNQHGIVKETSFDRYTARFNGEYPITDYLKIGTNLAYSRNLLNSLGGDVIGGAYRMPPVFAERDSTGDFTDPTEFGGSLSNPAADLFYKNDWKLKRLRWVGDVHADVKFLENFTFRSNFGFDRNDYRFYYFEPAFEVSNSQRNEVERTNRDTGDTHIWLWENTLTYDRTWDILHLNVLGGQTAQQYDYHRRNTIDHILQPNGEEFGQWAMLSFLFRTNATFFDRYLFTVSLRTDGSSRFAKGNRWGYFPSAALGWNVAQEPWMARQNLFDRLKLRASWGVVGNDKTQLYPSLGIITDELYSAFGDTIQQGATLINYANPDVRWETARQGDVGLEMGLVNGRLNFEVDWYRRYTYDILADLPIPDYVGSQATPVVNSAEVRNEGWDFTLGWRETRGKLTYNLNVIYSTVENEVTKLNQAKSEIFNANLGQGFATRTVVGLPIGAFYGYKVAGIFQNADDLTRYPRLANEQPGDFRFEDTNGDGVLTEDDRTYLGSPIPKITYGFSGGIELYGVDINADFFGVKGNKIINAKAAQTRFATNNWERLFYDGRWTGEGTSNEVPRASAEGFTHNTLVSDFFIADGSFLRLRSLVLGYSFPRNWLKSIGMSRLRIYASGTNLWTKQDYPGYSVEFPGDNPYRVGLDFLSYPLNKTYLVGLDVTF